MATYSNIGIKLITTGDESGTWGTSTNENFSDVLDEAIAGAITYNISSDADFTLTVSDGTSSDARHAVIKFTSTTLTATRVCTFAPNDLQKTWVVINSTTGGQSLTFKQGSAGGTVTVPNGESAIIYSDGGGASAGAITRVLDSFTNTKITTGTLNATTLDLTNLEVTNVKAKDGTAAITIADSTGKVTVSTELAVDNLNLSGNTITSTDTNGNIDLTPNGTGEVNITKVDIDSGAIDGTPIGANSASTGAFTTLSASGNITVSGGTANGVLYLNASKVATSGSDLVFNATGLGVGTSPAAKLHVSGAAAKLYVDLGGNNYYQATDQIWQNYGGGTEYMRLTSTGLGIGTSSPSGFLANKLVIATGGTANEGMTIYSSSNNGSIWFADATTGTGRYAGGLDYTHSDDTLIFYSAAQGNMRLNASGNLGLGVTPGTWNTGYRAFQFGATGALYSAVSGTDFVSLDYNVIVDASNSVYKQTDVATRYRQISGQHQWFNAPSGTAGNAITFTQAMTLDASGDLGVGTTSPNVGSWGRAITLQGPSNAAYEVTDGTVRTAVYANAGSTGGMSIETNHPLVFNTNSTERARITSGGLFQVVATGSNSTFTDGGQISLKETGNSPYISWHQSTGARIGYLQMASGGNCNLWIEANQPLVFATNNAERARITSGGYFKASNDGTYQGSTSSYHELRSTGAAGDWNTVVTNTTATGANAYGIRIAYTGSAPNGTGNAFLSCDDNASGATTRAVIRSNGGLANYQSNNVDLSDARTKKDIAPAASMWNKIGALEIVTYKYNDQTHDDVNVGVIAQQVEAVEPVWVDNDGFGETPEGEEPLKTVYTKDITFAAIKALQEAMARIEKLEAEVAALKGA